MGGGRRGLNETKQNSDDGIGIAIAMHTSPRDPFYFFLAVLFEQTCTLRAISRETGTAERDSGQRWLSLAKGGGGGLSICLSIYLFIYLSMSVCLYVCTYSFYDHKHEKLVGWIDR